MVVPVTVGKQNDILASTEQEREALETRNFLSGPRSIYVPGPQPVMGNNRFTNIPR